MTYPDTTDPVVALCAEGMMAEGAGDLQRARELFTLAWDTAANDYQGCVAAHYRARACDDAEQALRWNERCLSLANAVGDESVAPFYPSAYLNLGHSLEQLGRLDAAEAAYVEGESVLSRLGDDGYATTVRDAIARGRARVADQRR